MTDDKTPGKTTSPPVDQKNDQGQGSTYRGPSTMYQPKVRLEEWGPDKSGRAPGEKS